MTFPVNTNERSGPSLAKSIPGRGVRTRHDNDLVIDIAIRLGFRHEGRLRCYYPDGMDADIFGMLKKECNWF